MKKAQDRASVIEDALGSFEWLSQVGVWTAFCLAGISFLFWAGLEVSRLGLLSFAFLSITTFPLKTLRVSLQYSRNFTAICAVLLHALILQDEYERIPSVLLIIPSFLFVEIMHGWLWKVIFATALWGVHAYWSVSLLRLELSTREISSSIVGISVTLMLIFIFNGLHGIGKKIAAKKLETLKGGKVDFRAQRIHSSRLQILGELSAALVHELSTPVTNLQGFFSQLMDSDELRLNIKYVEITNRIEANLMRVRDLLLGFRSFSKLQPTEKLSFKSSDLFRDLDLLSRHAFQSQKVELRFEALPEDIEISGNRVEIGQVMMNFLLNALASSKGSKVKQVLAGSERDGTSLVFFVEDTGTGVPDDLKEKIFRPFFSTKGDEGSGLGLYISKIIADHHECRIEAKNARILKGSGARFELSFPESRIIVAKDLDRVA